jgi:hypothetical protein
LLAIFLKTFDATFIVIGPSIDAASFSDNLGKVKLSIKYLKVSFEFSMLFAEYSLE